MANMRFIALLSTFMLLAAAYPSHAPIYAAAYHGLQAPLAPDGRVIDTPEVAHAKAAHQAAHAAQAAEEARAAHAAAQAGDPSLQINLAASPRILGHAAGYSGADLTSNFYYGPPAPLAHDGRVVDTPEVAHAKAAHLAAHADQLSKIRAQSYAAPYAQLHW